MSAAYQERLEGAYRIGRIRRIRAFSYMVLVVVTAALCAVQVLARGPLLRPLYLPLESVIPTVLVMMFVAFLLGINFRHLEMKHTKSDGQRFLMMQNSIHEAMTLIIALGVVAVVFALPWVHAAAIAGASQTFDRTLTRNASYRVEGGVSTIDALGLSHATAVSVHAISGAVDVTIGKVGDTGEQMRVIAGQTWTKALDDSMQFVYNVTVTNPVFTSSAFSLTIVRDLFPALFSVVPFTFGLFVAANVGWYLRLRPMAERYKGASIFSRDHEESMAPGERVFGDSRTTSTMTPFLDLPPPPPSDLPPPEKEPMEPVVMLHVAPAEKLPSPPPAVIAPRPGASGEATLEVAARLAAEGKLEDALTKYDVLLRRNPNHTQAALGKAGVLLKLGRRPGALGLYRQILRDDKGNVEALNGCLAIHEADGAWRDALDIAHQVVALRPADADAHAKRGDILVAMKRPNDARAAYEKAVALRPDDPALKARVDRIQVDIPLLVSRAFIASSSGSFQAAVDAFNEVLRLEPDNLNIRVGKSAALRRLGRVEEARELLDEVLERNPVHSAALLTKAQLLSETGDLSGAVAALEALLAVHPADADALLERGDVLARMGRTEEAQASYEAAVKLNPDDRDAAEKLNALVEAESSRRDVLRELFHVRGVGPVKAKALIEAGFHSVEALRRATVEDLERIGGVPRKVAQDIVKHFRR